MTDYIKEMMRIAEIELLPLNCKKCGAQDFALGLCAEIDCEKRYPDFTPEKQLEIIKLIYEYGWTITIEDEKVKVFANTCRTWFEGYSKDFTQAFAQTITALLQAGELNGAKVREILEK